MATRKQRRKRQKEKRHEYEYVYVDDEGREVEAPAEVQPQQRRNGKPANAPVARGGRKIEPPSWTRVGKRALWVAPLMFLTLSLIARDLSLTQKISQTMLMLALFLPVSYMMDRTIYRTAVRRGTAKKT
jgi:hypothetical protein